MLENNVASNGRIQVVLPSGTVELEAFYDGPLGWQWRTIVAVLAIFGLAAACWWDLRRLRRAGGQVQPRLQGNARPRPDSRRPGTYGLTA